jgi:hypothetical protein
MASTKTKSATKKPPAGFSDPAVGAAFATYPKPLRTKLLALRRMIFETAAATEGVGALQETLKWGQPSYLTAESKSGSTIRIDRMKSGNQVAMYFHCQTDLVATFRELYPKDLTYSGNRAVIFGADDEIPEAALRHCVGLALTYHLRKRNALVDHDPRIAAAVSLDQREQGCCVGRMQAHATMRGGAAEPRQLIGAVNGEAVIKEDRVRHR